MVDEAAGRNILELLESILELTRVSAKDWRFEMRSSHEGMATLRIKGGLLNIYFDSGNVFLLDVHFPEGDYVYLSPMDFTGRMKGEVLVLANEIRDTLLESEELLDWKESTKIGTRIETEVCKMQKVVSKRKDEIEKAAQVPEESEVETPTPAVEKEMAPVSVWKRLWKRRT